MRCENNCESFVPICVSMSDFSTLELASQAVMCLVVMPPCWLTLE